jgi:hypothetical protein
MYSTVLPLTLPSLPSPHRQHLLTTAGLLSLHDAFAAVPAPRSLWRPCCVTAPTRKPLDNGVVPIPSSCDNFSVRVGMALRREHSIAGYSPNSMFWRLSAWWHPGYKRP